MNEDTDYPAYRARQLKAGIEYQDFIAQRLYLEGIPLVMFQSYKYQLAHGENLLGLEIKFDNCLAQTGRVWIEVLEKADPSHPEMVPAGIDRGDAWLFGIGNYEDFWIFSVKTLRRYRDRAGPQAIRENNYHTGKGFFLPRAEADRFAERYFNFRASPEPLTRQLIEECDLFSSVPMTCPLCGDFVPARTAHQCPPF